MQIYDCNSSGAQQWTVNDDGGLVNAGSGKCLDAAGHGTRLAISTCTGSANRHWARTAAPGLLKGGQSGRCVDVPNSNQANGTRPALWDCNGGGNQFWTSTTTNQSMVFAIKCLDAAGSATTDGTAVQTYDCNGSARQQWRVRSDGSVVGVGSGKCLDAYDNGTTNGTQLILWTCSGATNQRWARS